MQKSERSTYTSIDFRQWQSSGSLVISPKFQRRGVWNRAQRSYLIDTLLLDLPVPPVYIRVVQSDDKNSIVREVVDGQQRVSAILDYMDDKYSLANKIESNFVGKRYSELPEEQRGKIARYSLICEVFYGIADKDILRIFARLNTHSVKLNDQELRNGEYFGPFKVSCYALAFEHLEFWRKNKIFSETSIARMSEAELTSELVILLIDGLQDKKKSVNAFYQKYDETFPDRVKTEARFRSVIDVINEACPEGLADTEFRRTPLFYSLFGAVAHRLYGVGRMPIDTPKTPKLSKMELEQLQGTVVDLSRVVEVARESGEPPAGFVNFVNACLRQTDNLKPRQTRVETIYKSAFG